LERQLEYSPVLEKPNPPLRLLAAFQQLYPDVPPMWIVQAPGRETWIAAAPAPDGYTLSSADLSGRAAFNRRSALFKRSITQRPLPKWMRYASGVVVALCDAGFEVGGLRAVTCSEDRSFGPRHDHAVGMAVAALLHEMTEQPYTPEGILELVERVRRSYVEG
jgi:galactokinase